MKLRTLCFCLMSAVAFVAIVGCSAPTEPAVTPEPAATPAPAAPVATPSFAKLGEEVEADHFMVALSTDPAELKAGKVKLIAKVSHHGEPAAGATIKVSSDLPKMATRALPGS